MSDRLFVVVEYNQASGIPGEVVGEVVFDKEEAVERAVHACRQNRRDGRRERYAVFELDETIDTEQIEQWASWAAARP
jgi:hypothetical protein